MKKITAALLAAMSLNFGGCQTIDNKADTVVMSGAAGRQKQFILLGDGQHDADFTIALFKEGFKVRPIAITQKVTELVSPNKIVEYKQAGFRYALNLKMERTSMGCSDREDHPFYKVTMSVIDIDTNEIIEIITQDGPDGDCNGFAKLTSVWTLLAKELARTWK